MAMVHPVHSTPLNLLPAEGMSKCGLRTPGIGQWGLWAGMSLGRARSIGLGGRRMRLLLRKQCDRHVWLVEEA